MPRNEGLQDFVVPDQRLERELAMPTHGEHAARHQRHHDERDDAPQREFRGSGGGRG